MAADFFVVLLLPSFFAAFLTPLLAFFVTLEGPVLFVPLVLRVVEPPLAAFVVLFFAPLVFVAVVLVVALLAVAFVLDFAVVDLVGDFFAAPVLVVDDLDAVFVAGLFDVVLFVVDFVAEPVAFAAAFAGLFLAGDFVALAVVVLRVVLVAARVPFELVASSLAGTRTSCVKDVEPDGRRSSPKKIALPGEGCQHLRLLISSVTHRVSLPTPLEPAVGVPRARSCGRRTAGTSVAMQRSVRPTEHAKTGQI